jgi:hypothetical protein
MSSVVLPAEPTQPEAIKPPTLSAPLAPELATPKAFHKRCKEVARTVKAFIKENRSMQLVVEGKRYPRAEVWQFAAGCLGITPMVTKTEEVISDDGQELGFISIAHALNSQGRVISGAEAACMYSEADWAGKPSFQLRSMAETRSCSRVLRHVLAYIMVMAGLCPTPAEEMGPQPAKERDFKSQCSRSDCSNMISEKRRTDTRRKYGQAMCVPCEKTFQQEKGEQILSPINDPKFVQESVEKIKARKMNGAGPQPAIKLLDAQREEYPA